MAEACAESGLTLFTDNDPNVCRWLRGLIDAGLLAGEVLERSITDARAADVLGRHRVHWFAGIGGWELALRLAGWPAEWPVWSASCPCQPWSAAGKGEGVEDERHLWPEFFRHVREHRPKFIVGEQVASSDVLGSVAASESVVQTLQDREAVLGVLQELERGDPRGLQGMLEDARAHSEAKEPGQDEKGIQKVAGEEPGKGAGVRRQAPGQDAGAAVQPGLGRNSAPNRQRGVRTDRHTVRPDHPAGLERAVTGQDRLDWWLYERQRESGSLFAERDGEHMGAAEDFGDCVGDHCEAAESLKRFVESSRDDLAAKFEPVWFDGIRSDLEKIGYAVWACDLAAAGIGAPHIRQRLYWGAVRLADAERRATERRRHDLGAAAGGDPGGAEERQRVRSDAGDVGHAGGLADSQEQRWGQRGPHIRGSDSGVRPQGDRGGPADGGDAGGLGDAAGHGHRPAAVGGGDRAVEGDGRGGEPGGSGTAGLSLNPWAAFDLIPCRDTTRDGRRVYRRGPAGCLESGVQLVVDGLPAGVGGDWVGGLFPTTAAKIPGRAAILRGFGNAIVIQAAAVFLRAFLDAITSNHGET